MFCDRKTKTNLPTSNAEYFHHYSSAATVFATNALLVENLDEVSRLFTSSFESYISDCYNFFVLKLLLVKNMESYECTLNLPLDQKKIANSLRRTRVGPFTNNLLGWIQH
jgi:hypothetical protein